MSHHPHPQPSGHQTHAKSKHASLSPHHPSVTNPNASAHSSSSSSHSRHQPNIVGVHYRVEKKIGQGSFGIIYSGTNLLNNQQVAIKFEPRKADVPQLRDEYRAYRILAGLPGIPSAYYFGQEGLYNVLCIDLLGSSLEDLFDLCRRKFSVKTVALLAKQMITRVQSVHEKSLIYRDIKPDNFLMGKPHTKGANIVHLVDFGMVKQYRDPKTKQHIPYRERKSLSGTARYMSINTHLGREQSRRDDLEALGHVFMYFLRGSLPWQGLKAVDNKQKYQKISETKQLTSIKDLCHGFPEEFQTYMTYTRKLAFEETPNYDYLRGLMDSVLNKIGAAGEIDTFDWLSPRGSSSNVQLNPDTSGNTNDLHSVEAATKMTLHGSRMLNKSLPTNNATNTNLTLPDPSRGNGETIGQYGTNLHNSDTHAHKDYSSPQYGMNQPNTSSNIHQGGNLANNGASGEAHNKNKPENPGFLSKAVDCITCRACSS